MKRNTNPLKQNSSVDSLLATPSIASPARIKEPGNLQTNVSKQKENQIKLPNPNSSRT